MGGDGLWKYEAGAMMPPSIIPPKAFKQHVIKPQKIEPTTLMPYRKAAKHARHAADNHSWAGSGYRPVMHHAKSMESTKELQLLSKLEADITHLWSDLSSKFSEQQLLAHQMNPYMARAFSAEKLQCKGTDIYDGWTKLLAYMQAMDKLLAQYAKHASRLDKLQKKLKNAEAGCNKSLGTSTISDSLVQIFRHSQVWH